MRLAVVNDAGFSAEASGLLALLFTSPWCTGCHKVAQALAKLSDSFVTIRFGELDIVANPATPQALGVLGIPTVILLKDGQEICRLAGDVSEKALIRELKKLAC